MALLGRAERILFLSTNNKSRFDLGFFLEWCGFGRSRRGPVGLASINHAYHRCRRRDCWFGPVRNRGQCRLRQRAPVVAGNGAWGGFSGPMQGPSIRGACCCEMATGSGAGGGARRGACCGASSRGGSGHSVGCCVLSTNMGEGCTVVAGEGSLSGVGGIFSQVLTMCRFTFFQSWRARRSR